MAKLTNQDFFLNHMLNNCDYVVLTDQPHNNLTNALASSPKMQRATTPADFVIAEGDDAGRKISLNELTNILVEGNGVISHINFFSGTTHIHTTDRTIALEVVDGELISVDPLTVIELGEPT